MKLRAAAITDIGRVRRNNEDRFLCRQTQGLFGVADGIGGLPRGALASQTAIDAICERFDERPEFSPEFVSEAIQHANQTVAELGRTVAPESGIGSTLTLGYVRDDQIILGHVGDSRCLLFSNSEIIPLTTDQTVGQMLAEGLIEGEFPDGTAIDPAMLKALAQCIGQPTPLRVDVSTHTVCPGDRLLFATDGVTGVLSPTEIAAILNLTIPLSERLAKLITAVNQGGAPDNATAVVIEFE